MSINSSAANEVFASETGVGRTEHSTFNRSKIGKFEDENEDEDDKLPQHSTLPRRRGNRSRSSGRAGGARGRHFVATLLIADFTDSIFIPIRVICVIRGKINLLQLSLNYIIFSP